MIFGVGCGGAGMMGVVLSPQGGFGGAQPPKRSSKPLQIKI